MIPLLCLQLQRPLRIQQIILRMTDKSFLSLPKRDSQATPAAEYQEIYASGPGSRTFHLECGENLATQWAETRSLCDVPPVIPLPSAPLTLDQLHLYPGPTPPPSRNNLGLGVAGVRGREQWSIQGPGYVRTQSALLQPRLLVLLSILFTVIFILF